MEDFIRKPGNLEERRRRASEDENEDEDENDFNRSITPPLHHSILPASFYLD
jgi:hypothetical protein